MHEAFGDDYGADLIVAGFRRRGIAYKNVTILEKGRQVRLNHSEIYLNSIGLFAAGRVRLPDNPRLTRQLVDLERRAGRGSTHDVVDHPRGRHDDLANSVCALLVLLGARPGGGYRISPAAMAWASGYDTPRKLTPALRWASGVGGEVAGPSRDARTREIVDATGFPVRNRFS